MIRHSAVKLLYVGMVVAVALSACAAEEPRDEPGIEARRAARAAQTIRLVYPDWSSEVAGAHLIQAVLQERLGYRVQLMQTDAEGMWRMVADGEADVLAGAWLPVTHDEYFRDYGGRLEDLGPNLHGARIGLVVPTATPGRQTEDTGRTGRDLVTIRSIDELADHADRFEGRIIGIESGAGVMARAQEALEVYGLERSFRLIESDEERMIAEVNDAIRSLRWVVFTGWTPHWSFERHNMRFLDDPQAVFGGVEAIHTMTRTGFAEDMPDAYETLRRMEWEPRQLERLMIWIHDDSTGDVYRQALRWIRTHSDLVDEWVRDIE